MDIKNISTEDLTKELARRKEHEIPILVDEINNKIQSLKVMVGKIEYASDCYELDDIYIKDGRVYYSDKEY